MKTEELICYSAHQDPFFLGLLLIFCQPSHTASHSRSPSPSYPHFHTIFRRSLATSVWPPHTFPKLWKSSGNILLHCNPKCFHPHRHMYSSKTGLELTGYGMWAKSYCVLGKLSIVWLCDCSKPPKSIAEGKKKSSPVVQSTFLVQTSPFLICMILAWSQSITPIHFFCFKV